MNEFMKERERLVGLGLIIMTGQVLGVYERADTWLVTRIYANAIKLNTIRYETGSCFLFFTFGLSFYWLFSNIMIIGFGKNKDYSSYNISSYYRSPFWNILSFFFFFSVSYRLEIIFLCNYFFSWHFLCNSL